jgi:hypothetical protein
VLDGSERSVCILEGDARGPRADRTTVIAALHNPLTVFETNDLSNVTMQDAIAPTNRLK